MLYPRKKNNRLREYNLEYWPGKGMAKMKNDIERIEKDLKEILTDEKMWLGEKKLWLMAIDTRVKAGYYSIRDNEREKQ